MKKCSYSCTWNFKAKTANYSCVLEPVIESLTPSAWKYGRFIEENGPCLKSWNEFTNAGYDCSALSPSHTSGHKPVNVPFGKDLWWAELLPSSQSFHINPPRHTHTHIHTHPPFDFCLVLCAPLGFSVFLFHRRSAMGFLAVLPSLCMPGVAKPRLNPLELKCFSAESAQSETCR